MTTDFLRGLLRENIAGVVPQKAEGFYEPLAAVYPRSAAPTAAACLRCGALALQPFVRTLVAAGSVNTRPIIEAESALFANWNQPDDLLP